MIYTNLNNFRDKKSPVQPESGKNLTVFNTILVKYNEGKNNINNSVFIVL